MPSSSAIGSPRDQWRTSTCDRLLWQHSAQRLQRSVQSHQLGGTALAPRDMCFCSSTLPDPGSARVCLLQGHGPFGRARARWPLTGCWNSAVSAGVAVHTTAGSRHSRQRSPRRAPATVLRLAQCSPRWPRKQGQPNLLDQAARTWQNAACGIWSCGHRALHSRTLARATTRRYTTWPRRVSELARLRENQTSMAIGCLDFVDNTYPQQAVTATTTASTEPQPDSVPVTPLRKQPLGNRHYG
jgi:hypothetical protein